jgi:hypothetical protein
MRRIGGYAADLTASISRSQLISGFQTGENLGEPAAKTLSRAVHFQGTNRLRSDMVRIVPTFADRCCAYFASRIVFSF